MQLKRRRSCALLRNERCIKGDCTAKAPVCPEPSHQHGAVCDLEFYPEPAAPCSVPARPHAQTCNLYLGSAHRLCIVHTREFVSICALIARGETVCMVSIYDDRVRRSLHLFLVPSEILLRCRCKGRCQHRPLAGLPPKRSRKGLLRDLSKGICKRRSTACLRSGVSRRRCHGAMLAQTLRSVHWMRQGRHCVRGQLHASVHRRAYRACGRRRWWQTTILPIPPCRIASRRCRRQVVRQASTSVEPESFSFCPLLFRLATSQFPDFLYLVEVEPILHTHRFLFRPKSINERL